MTVSSTCPLCGGSASSLEKTFEVSQIVGDWKRSLAIDVSGGFHGLARFYLFCCGECPLGFFQPDSVAGSPSLYENLEKFDWYYMKRKWEHDAALEDLDSCENGIEGGCGFGDF